MFDGQHEALEDKSQAKDDLNETTMSALMEELYFERGIVSSSNVSVHSAFICILHLANEKGLSFELQNGKFK